MEFHILDIDPLRLAEPPSDKLVQVFEIESVLAVVKPDVGYAVVVAQLPKGALPDPEKCCCLFKIQQPVNDLNFGLHPPGRTGRRFKASGNPERPNPSFTAQRVTFA